MNNQEKKYIGWLCRIYTVVYQKNHSGKNSKGGLIRRYLMGKTQFLPTRILRKGRRRIIAILLIQILTIEIC